MGNAKLRRLMQSEAKWADKSAAKHRHDFGVDCVLQLIRPTTVEYYQVRKCRHCNSFVCVPKPGSAFGMLQEVPAGLPMLVFSCEHKWIIGFHDLVFKEFLERGDCHE